MARQNGLSGFSVFAAVCPSRGCGGGEGEGGLGDPERCEPGDNVNIVNYIFLWAILLLLTVRMFLYSHSLFLSANSL